MQSPMVQDCDRSRWSGDKALPHVHRRLSAGQQRAKAMELRTKGWSYRRIAEELRLSYSVISAWLDGAAPWGENGGGANVPLERQDKKPSAPVSICRNVPDNATSSERRLSARMDKLEENQEALQTEIIQVERRLSATIKDVYQSLSEKLRNAFSRDK